MPPRVPIADARAESDSRRAIYADLEELLIPGFLAQEVSLGGAELSLRTLFPSEASMMRHRVGLHGTARSWREWAVACSVWVLDGQVLLADPNAALSVRGAVRSVPQGALDALFSVYTTLHNRVRTALSRLEAFCYEDHSRGLWRMVGRGNPSVAAGVPGVSALGMNHVQRLWVAYNLAEDDRVQWYAEWAAAKLVASAQAPKGIKKLNARDDGERKLEDERRQRVISDAFHEATGRRVGEQSRVVLHRAVTPDELSAEMERWVRGEKDQHDLVIDAYKDQIRVRQEADRRRHEERMRSLDDLVGAGVGVAASASLMALTPEQLREFQTSRGASPQGGRSIVDGSNAARLYDKYVASPVVPGGIGADGRPVALPPRPSSLNDEVAARRPRLDEEGR